MTFDYEGWLKAAQGRLENLYEQKAAIESEISKLEKAIQGFMPLVKQPSKWFGPAAGLTDGVREVFKSAPARHFTAIDIRNELVRRGMTLKQKNPMASIHQILSRLVDDGKVEIHTHEPGRNRYRWKEPQKK